MSHVQRCLYCTHLTRFLEVGPLGEDRISADFDGSFIYVTVCGSAYSIAECGEQLGWLLSALQVAEPDSLGSTVALKPVLTRKRFIEYSWDIEYASELVRATPYLDALEGTTMPLVVSGYPTARRPKCHPGVEVSAHFAMDLVGEPKLITGDEIILYGPRGALRLVKTMGEMLTWHRLSSGCSCILTDMGYRNSPGPYSLDIPQLCNYRHILGICVKGQIPLEAAQDTLPKGTRKIRVADLLCSPFVADASAIPGATSDLEDRPPSPSLSASRGASPDSDMLSISESSTDESMGSATIDIAFDVVIEAVADRLLSEFREDSSQWVGSTVSHCPEDNNSSNNPKSENRTSTSTTNSGSNATVTARAGAKRQSRKRTRAGGNDDEDGEDILQMPPPKRKKQSQRKRLACPFWKHDSSKHEACFLGEISKIAYVKQHLRRKHTPEFYCQRCLSIFTNGDAYHQHNSQAAWSCVWNKDATLDAVTYQQTRLLHRKSNPSVSEESQWFAIWDILFPTEERPTSAYIEAGLSEEFYRLDSLMSQDLPVILAEELVSNGMTASEQDLPLLARRVAERTRTRFAAAWSATRRTSNSLTASDNGTTGPAQRGTPGSSTVDSGVALTTQAASSSGSLSSHGTSALENVDAQLNAHANLDQPAPDEISNPPPLHDATWDSIAPPVQAGGLTSQPWAEYQENYEDSWGYSFEDPDIGDPLREWDIFAGVPPRPQGP